MANILSVKSRVDKDLSVLLALFPLGRMLSHIGMRKGLRDSLDQFIVAICLFRVCGERLIVTIHYLKMKYGASRWKSASVNSL